MRVVIVAMAIFFAGAALLSGCASQQPQVKATGQMEIGAGYGRK